MQTTIKCWRYDCVAGVSTEATLTRSGDYTANNGVIHVGWHNGRLITSASCARHMGEQLLYEWELHAKQYGVKRTEEKYGPKPEVITKQC